VNVRTQAPGDFGRRRGLRGLALIAVIVGIVAGAGSAGATTQTKFYGASVSPVSGEPVAANSNVTYTLTLKNESNSTQTVGSGNFWAPAGWTVNSVVSTPVHSLLFGDTWNISKQSGSTAPDGTKTDAVQFRAATNNDALTPGDSVSAQVVATAACTAGAAVWQTEVKQANNFSGNPGNDFQPTQGDVNTTVTVSPAALGSFVFNTIGTQKTNLQFTVTITAKDTCGNTKTDYSGTNAVLSGNPFTGTIDSQTWTNGVDTAKLTPTVSQLGAKLHVQDGAIGADSNKFNVVDDGLTCTTATITCELTNGTTTVDADTPTGNQLLNLGLVSGAGVTFTGCSGGALSGEAVVTVDPTNYTGPFTVTLTYDKSIAPGTGVSNFVVCKSNDNGATWEQLSPCKNHPSPPCISSRNRTGAGDLVETLLVTPTDPAYGTD
jgi:hypothetical protein